MIGRPKRLTHLTVGYETHSVEEWSRMTGLRKELIRSRIHKGWAPEDAIEQPPRQNRGPIRLTVGDETHSAEEWSRITGIRDDLIRSRIRRGWTPEEVVGRRAQRNLGQLGRLTVGNESHTVEEQDAIRPGPIEKPKPSKGNKTGRARLVEWKGTLYTVAELALKTGIHPRTLSKRLKDGEAVEEAMIDRTKPLVHLTVGNETHSVEEWARMTGLRPDLIHSRLRRGRSPEEAVHVGRLPGSGLKSKGTRNGNARMTPAKVRAIRKDRRPRHVIAEEYGISGVSVWHIKTRATWKHVEDDDTEVAELPAHD
jgi:hypothetical protein